MREIFEQCPYFIVLTLIADLIRKLLPDFKSYHNVIIIKLSISLAFLASKVIHVE